MLDYINDNCFICAFIFFLSFLDCTRVIPLHHTYPLSYSLCASFWRSIICETATYLFFFYLLALSSIRSTKCHDKYYAVFRYKKKTYSIWSITQLLYFLVDASVAKSLLSVNPTWNNDRLLLVEFARNEHKIKLNRREKKTNSNLTQKLHIMQKKRTRKKKTHTHMLIHRHIIDRAILCRC